MKRLLLLFLLCASLAQADNIQLIVGDPSRLQSQISSISTRMDSQEALYWEDLRFPATAINLPGAPADPSIDTTNYLGALKFSGSQINDVTFIAQMPHGYKTASTIESHMHVVNGSTATTNTVWELRYRKAAVDGTFPADWTVATTTASLAGSTTQHQMVGLGDITMTGMGDSSIIMFWLRRLGSTDAHNDDVILLEFDLHYQTDRRGSTAEHGDAQ